MDEALIQEQERQLQKTGQYYKHIFWLCVPLLCMACYFYGARPLLLCGIICLVCKKHTFLWIGWVISLFLALSPYYFFWVHVNYFSWIAVFIWAFVTVGYIVWQGTAEKRRRERY